MLGAVVFAVVMTTTGGLCIWVARRAMQSIDTDGRHDFVFGGHTRDNTSIQAWTAAHEIAGAAMVRGGWLYVLCGVVGAVFLVNLSAGQSAAAILVLIVAATGVLLRGVGGALNCITRSKSARDC